jgi:hypothetical protein
VSSRFSLHRLMQPFAAPPWQLRAVDSGLKVADDGESLFDRLAGAHFREAPVHHHPTAGGQP